MAIRPDDLIITTYDSQPVMDVVDDLTTQISWRVEIRGAAATVTSPQVILRRDDSNSVTLATVTAASGEVTADVTAAELDTATAQIGDDLIAELTGTVSDGGDTHQVRHRAAVTVVSRASRAAVSYDELTGRYSQLAKSCALPSGQTTFHPQMRIGLRDYRREMHTRFGRRPDVLYPDQEAALQVAYVMVAVIGFVRSQGSGQSDYWDGELEWWRTERDRLWDRLMIVVESGDREDWGQVPSTAVHPVESSQYRSPRHDGPVSYGGGM